MAATAATAPHATLIGVQTPDENVSSSLPDRSDLAPTNRAECAAVLSPIGERRDADVRTCSGFPYRHCRAVLLA